MKKIINNKLYDTDTAKRLGYDGGGDGFDSWTEELYKKRTGEYFIYGEGGARTRYGEFVDGPDLCAVAIRAHSGRTNSGRRNVANINSDN